MTTQPETVSTSDDKGRLATGLGWFSVGLGLAELLAPSAVATLIGIRNRGRSNLLIRLYGIREIGAGIGILAQSRPTGWLWGRVAGDAADLSSLGWALAQGSTDKTRAAIATAAVSGVTALDVLSAKNLSATTQSSGPVRVAKTITIDRPAEDLYQFWHDFGNFPTLLDQLESVHATGANHSHWKLNIAGGRSIEWDSEITEETPNSRIAWRTAPGSHVQHSGSVRFEPATGGRGTVVRVELHYAFPGGATAAKIAKLFGMAPGQHIETALRHLKQLMETGEIAKSDASIHPSLTHPGRPPEKVPQGQMAAGAGA
ncbi:MAG TPA: SRPBCC family protein [Bryobacteraceae bacterium]|jgi:uncharacterized membrane protein|nr:SRPBCC family protein [Bryobacteraceae bacterium]